MRKLGILSVLLLASVVSQRAHAEQAYGYWVCLVEDETSMKRYFTQPIAYEFEPPLEPKERDFDEEWEYLLTYDAWKSARYAAFQSSQPEDQLNFFLYMQDTYDANCDMSGWSLSRPFDSREDALKYQSPDRLKESNESLTESFDKTTTSEVINWQR